LADVDETTGGHVSVSLAKRVVEGVDAFANSGRLAFNTTSESA
jgi:hypothetical protein